MESQPIESQLQEDSVEVDGGKYSVHFESGDHSSTRHEADVFAKISEGQLDNFWNEEVAQRIKYNPGVLVPDSLQPGQYEAKPGGLDFDLGTKRWIWASLPGRPSKINGSGEVIVINGDTQIPANLLEPLGIDRDQLAQINSSVRKSLGTLYQESQRNSTGEAVKVNALAATLIGATLLSEITDPNRGKGQMSRRKFLARSGQWAAGGLLASMIGGQLLPRAAAHSSSSKFENFVEALGPIIKDKFSPDTWTNGRTALNISKCMEGMRQGLVSQGSSGAVLMGYGHGLKAHDYLHGSGERQRAIFNYAKQITGILDDAVGLVPEVSKSKARNALLDLIAQSDIAVVTDPGTDRVESKDANRVIDNNVRYAGSFTTPEILEAVKPLRPNITS